MKQMVREVLDVPVRNECDILVVGAGPAGMGAAITAARKGAKVTLVEYGGKLGGMWTLGLLSPFFDNQKKEGLNSEFREKLMERKAWGGLWNISFDPTEMTLLMNRYAMELGIDVLQAHTDATQGKGHERWFTHKVPADGSLPFTHWNLQKKYGRPDYEKDFYNVMVKRLDAWGINTIGNWSKTDVMILGRKPYTMQLSDFARGFPRFRKSNVKFYDVFDPEFEEKMGNILRDRAEVDEITRKSINDPMCIGYFIDNELRFNDIMKAVFGAEPDQPAKQAFIADLKEKYGTIEKLNKAWGTDFADWEKLAENRSMPKGRGYRADSDAFYAKFVDRYFRICREGIKKTAPHRLYLGCRFVGFRQSKAAQDAAAKYCDVVSVNTYQNSVANVDPKSFGEKPILIGEFHFGTYDRGMFSNGLCPTADQTERATAFLRYVQGALVHPNMVGVHWFQFRDQPLTGRWDGEGYQIGFVDVADTPYPELIKAAREAGENMYTYRKNGKLVNAMK